MIDIESLFLIFFKGRLFSIVRRDIIFLTNDKEIIINNFFSQTLGRQMIYSVVLSSK